ncbi:MAG: universal stress protein [Rhodobacteraceae bacterium]|jgi:nucleotide-binding universal stress UspA family protein|uniref:universal stress protein n=1 Tax=unclassified Marivita TaxID=2632480 RepID=UPI000D7B611C|nr:universal stress protein [Marivita sp. XM-24bin2]MCR9110682.1 universal stress protein [Paracoccaceae bacterium]PWL33766.1 MAG: universal stress protein UspA [Marivita sp. XM-24bin2]
MFRKILVPVDLSIADETQKLLAHAKTLSEQWGSEVHVVSVIPNVGMPIVGSYMDEGFETSARIETETELAHQIDASGVDATAHVLNGTVYDRVIALAKSLDVDLILITAHQPDLKDYLLGSNAARLVRHSGRSVLVLRD